MKTEGKPLSKGLIHLINYPSETPEELVWVISLF
jgi:hypothetical protein